MPYRTWLIILMLLISGSMSSLALGQTPTPTPPPKVDPQKVRLQKGDKAPFDGVVLNNDALAILIEAPSKELKLLKLEVEKLKKELELEKQKATEVCAAKLIGEQLKYAACSKDADRQRELLDKVTNPPWYKSPYVSFIFGSAISAGVCAAASRIK